MGFLGEGVGFEGEGLGSHYESSGALGYIGILYKDLQCSGVPRIKGTFEFLGVPIKILDPD